LTAIQARRSIPMQYQERWWGT